MLRVNVLKDWTSQLNQEILLLTWYFNEHFFSGYVNNIHWYRGVFQFFRDRQCWDGGENRSVRSKTTTLRRQTNEHSNTIMGPEWDSILGGERRCNLKVRVIDYTATKVPSFSHRLTGKRTLFFEWLHVQFLNIGIECLPFSVNVAAGKQVYIEDDWQVFDGELNNIVDKSIRRCVELEPVPGSTNTDLVIVSIDLQNFTHIVEIDINSGKKCHSTTNTPAHV